LMVMNTILGGQFSSRLNMNLREKHAYTYGASSSFDMRHGAGPFTAGGAIVREKTEPAAQEILAEIKRLQESLVTDEEIVDAKTNLIRRLPAAFETVSDVAGSLAYLAIYDLPLDEFAKRAEGYRAVTAADVQRVATTYLKLDRLRLVIVGDADVIEKDLEKLELGKIEVRRAKKK
jgi:zinc protease